MKAFRLLLLTLLLVGCRAKTTPDSTIQRNGHTYQVFHLKNDVVLHDPDCPKCLQVYD